MLDMGVPLALDIDYRAVIPRIAAPLTHTLEVPAKAVTGLKPSSPRSGASRVETGESSERPPRNPRIAVRSLVDAFLGEELRDVVNLANIQFRNGNLASAAQLVRRAHRLVNEPEGRSGERTEWKYPLSAEPEVAPPAEEEFTSPEGAPIAAASRMKISLPMDEADLDDGAKFVLFRTTASRSELRPETSGVQLSAYA